MPALRIRQRDNRQIRNIVVGGQLVCCCGFEWSELRKRPDVGLLSSLQRSPDPKVRPESGKPPPKGRGKSARIHAGDGLLQNFRSPDFRALSHWPRWNFVNPSRFGIVTFGSVCAFIVASSAMTPLRLSR
jgi:hypothetical protein